MTSRLALRENQVRAIIRAARKEGARVEVKIGDAILTVIPSDDAAPDPEIGRGKEIRL